MKNDKKSLPDAAFTNPQQYRGTFTVQEAAAMILTHGGRILACGESWDIECSKPQVGTVTVSLKKTEY